ncbi:MAG: hypothetical protein R3C28_21905 [Pirellulaceae bacterium]
MRFSTAVPNVGDGPLCPVVRSGGRSTRCVSSHCGWKMIRLHEKLAGQFVYHAGHDHIHLDEYAEYNLREITPEGGGGEK